MGKKRRLNKAKAKFAHKLSAHPRARLLATPTSNTQEVQVESPPAPQEPVVAAEVKPTPTSKKEVAPTTEATPPTPKKTTRTKRPPAKKKTTTRKSRAKKAPSTEKRA